MEWLMIHWTVQRERTDGLKCTRRDGAERTIQHRQIIVDFQTIECVINQRRCDNRVSKHKMIQSHILEGLSVYAIDDAVVKWNIVQHVGHTVDGKRQQCADVTIDEFDTFDAAAERVRYDFIHVHLKWR